MAEVPKVNCVVLVLDGITAGVQFPAVFQLPVVAVADHDWARAPEAKGNKHTHNVATLEVNRANRDMNVLHIRLWHKF